ncbi:MAG: Na+/H+ antiporter NhaA [Candidatus Hydrogenedentes bacterium]|nr:Na+/H+ antiporter NhaA [Candidatus Hydrogenedentota bacterium]
MRAKSPNPPPLDQVSTLQKLLHHGAMAAVFLLAASASAFFLANCGIKVLGVPVYEWYAELWHVNLGFYIHGEVIAKSLHHLVNDGLMAIFFFMVGLEIKRELLVGELASFRKALLPILAAIGGMACPAIIYSAINIGGDGAPGWGIPMATDIAFCAGILGLLTRRVPPSLAVFLIALAIVDDLGSVAVIALFYTDTIATRPLLVGLGMIVLSFFFARIGVRNALVFTLMFVVIWVEFFLSGVHATVAGVLFAFTIPADARYESPLFISRVGQLLDRFREAERSESALQVNSKQQRVVRAIEEECVHVEAPLQRIEHKLHPITAFIIMPIFAFANSGVHLEFSQLGSLLLEPVTLGVAAGLLLGKQAGIMGASWLAVRSGLAELPQGVRWLQLWGVSWLAGIGFTMSLFIGGLAFPAGHDAGHGSVETASHVVEMLTGAKVGTLAASLVAGVCGSAVLLLAGRPADRASSETHGHDHH